MATRWELYVDGRRSGRAFISPDAYRPGQVIATFVPVDLTGTFSDDTMELRMADHIPTGFPASTPTTTILQSLLVNPMIKPGKAEWREVDPPPSMSPPP